MTCGGSCVSTYRDKFHSRGEKMARSCMLGNYNIVMKHLYKNPHLFLYDAGPYHRNIFRYAIFRTIEKGEDYTFLQILLDFGKTNLTPEEYNMWLNSYNCLDIKGIGTYYKYPIYKNDLKMIRFLLKCEIPFPSEIILCCVSNTLGRKFRPTFDTNIMIEMMFEFLSRGANSNGCKSNNLYSWSYLSFTFSIIFCEQTYKKNEFKKMLELLYIYGIEFDRGNIFLDRFNFSTEEDYNRYRCLTHCHDPQGLSLYWLSNNFYEIICEIMTCGCSNTCLIIRSNILYIFILYFSDKYNVDFSLQASCGFVTQYFDHFLTNNIYKLIIDSAAIIEAIDNYEDQSASFQQIFDKMNCFILSTEQKIPFLLYLIEGKNNTFFEYYFAREIILSYL
jgi:hypothetical protein